MAVYRAILVAILASAVSFAARANPVRIAIFDIDAPGVTGADVSELPDLMTQIITSHEGYAVVPVADVHHAVEARQKPRAHCSTDMTCVLAVARDTRADFAIVGSYAQRKGRYVFEMLRFDGKIAAPPLRATEESDGRANLPKGAAACLDKLFNWPVVPGPVPSPPVVAEPAPSPPPAPVAPPSAVPHKESLALIAVKRGEGFSEKQATTIEELLLAALDATGKFKVIGQSDIAAVLSLDAQKQSVGCNDTDCAVQIAGALGVDFVATANVGRLGSNTVLTLKLIAVRSASVVARAEQTVRNDDDLPNATRTLAEQVIAMRNAVTAPLVAAHPMEWQRVLGWVGVGVGAALLATGAGLGVSSLRTQGALHSTPHSAATAVSEMNSSNGTAIGADATLIGGGILTAGGVGLVVF